MSQHFLLSAKARTLSLGAALRMTDQEAETAFRSLRWATTDGKPVCPHCECPTVYEARRPNGALSNGRPLASIAYAATCRAD
jgi:hypothetical protein